MEGLILPCSSSSSSLFCFCCLKRSSNRLSLWTIPDVLLDLGCFILNSGSDAHYRPRPPSSCLVWKPRCMVRGFLVLISVASVFSSVQAIISLLVWCICWWLWSCFINLCSCSNTKKTLAGPSGSQVSGIRPKLQGIHDHTSGQWEMYTQYKYMYMYVYTCCFFSYRRTL